MLSFKCGCEESVLRGPYPELVSSKMDWQMSAVTDAVGKLCPILRSIQCSWCGIPMVVCVTDLDWEPMAFKTYSESMVETRCAELSEDSLDSESWECRTCRHAKEWGCLAEGLSVSERDLYFKDHKSGCPKWEDGHT